jgi:hypothetical protein
VDMRVVSRSDSRLKAEAMASMSTGLSGRGGGGSGKGGW